MSRRIVSRGRFASQSLRLRPLSLEHFSKETIKAAKHSVGPARENPCPTLAGAVFSQTLHSYQPPLRPADVLPAEELKRVGAAGRGSRPRLAVIADPAPPTGKAPGDPPPHASHGESPSRTRFSGHLRLRNARRLSAWRWASVFSSASPLANASSIQA